MFKLQTSAALALAGALSLTSLAASAQTATPVERGASTPHIAQKQDRQQQRIDQAAASGGLNAAETNRLNKQETHISNMEDKAAADGSVTAKERTRIRSAERRTNRHIARQAHDGQTATPATTPQQ